MSKRPKPFEDKGKKKTRLPKESFWRDGLSFFYGGGAGNRTPVRNYSASSVYMRSRCVILTCSGSHRQNQEHASAVEISRLNPAHEKPLVHVNDVRSGSWTKHTLNAGEFMVPGYADNATLGSHCHCRHIVFVCSCCSPGLTRASEPRHATEASTNPVEARSPPFSAGKRSYSARSLRHACLLNSPY